MRYGMEKIIWDVLPFCFTISFTFNHRLMLPGSGIFSLGMKSLMGHEVLKALARVHGRPLDLHSSWMSRAVMSRHNTYPATWSMAEDWGIAVPPLPITTPSSTSWWRVAGVEGKQDRRPFPNISRTGLQEKHRFAGNWHFWARWRDLHSFSPTHSIFFPHSQKRAIFLALNFRVRHQVERPATGNKMTFGRSIAEGGQTR